MPEPVQFTAPATSQRLMELTWLAKEELWMNNFAENLPLIRQGADISQIPKATGPCVVLGGGPSALENLNKLAALDRKRRPPLIVCDKMLIPTLSLDIVPDFVVSIDGDVIIAKFFECVLPPGLRAIFNLSIHPTVAKKFTDSFGWPFPVYWFLAIIDNPHQAGPNLTRAFHYMSDGKTLLDGMGNVGGTAWNLANYLGYDPICLIGLDFAYDVDEQHLESTPYYPHFLKMSDGKREVAERFYRKHKNKFGNTVVTDIMFLFYRDILAAYVKMAKTTTIQCSHYTILDSPPIKQMSFEEFLSKYAHFERTS